jgi:hypothetical protein
MKYGVLFLLDMKIELIASWVVCVGLLVFYVMVNFHFGASAPTWLLALMILASFVKCGLLASLALIAFPPKWEWLKNKYPWLLD